MKKFTIIMAIIVMTGIVAAQPTDFANPGQTPDNALYGLDMAFESVQIGIASVQGPNAESNVRANIAQERLAEAEVMAQKNATEEVSDLVDDYTEQSERAMEAANRSDNPNAIARVANKTNDSTEVLRTVRERVNEQARNGIDQAIESSQQRGQNLEDIGDRVQKRLDEPAKRSESGNRPVETPKP